MLKPCPSSPNCVSTEASDARHAVASLRLKLVSEATWSEIRSAVLSLPRTTLAHERAGYLHAECRSFLFRFVDDLELELRPEERIIAARSAARIGHFDFGVNRRRLERLRQILQDKDLLS